jgi:hypothetical protein
VLYPHGERAAEIAQMLIDAGANLEAEDVSRCCMPAWLTC